MPVEEWYRSLDAPAVSFNSYLNSNCKTNSGNQFEQKISVESVILSVKIYGRLLRISFEKLVFITSANRNFLVSNQDRLISYLIN